MTVEERFAEIHHRYGPDHVVTHALERSARNSLPQPGGRTSTPIRTWSPGSGNAWDLGSRRKQ
jgi:hypothetical protein